MVNWLRTRLTWWAFVVAVKVVMPLWARLTFQPKDKSNAMPKEAMEALKRDFGIR